MRMTKWISFLAVVFSTYAHATFPTITPPARSAFLDENGYASFIDDQGNILPIAVLAAPDANGVLSLPSHSVTSGGYSQVTGLPNAPIYTDTSGHKAPVFAMYGITAGALTPISGVIGGTGAANQALSNLTSPTAIGQNLLPAGPGTLSIGQVGKEWVNLFVNAIHGVGNSSQVGVSISALVDQAGTGSMDWNARLLANQNQNLSIDYQNGYLNNGDLGFVQVNWLDDLLADDTGVLAGSWNSTFRHLIDFNGVTSVDFGNRLLGDASLQESVDWGNRSLVDSNGNGELGWGTEGVIVGGGSNSNNYALQINEYHMLSLQDASVILTPQSHAGTGATCTVGQATDIAGTVTITTGTGSSSGAQCLLAFGHSYHAAPSCSLTPANAAAAVAQGWVGTTTTGLTISNTSAVDSTVYLWNYQCIETQLD